MGESVEATLPAGPKYATVEDNPVEYKDKVQHFIPGHIHTKVEAWRALRPRMDVEVLAWIEQGYQVKSIVQTGHLLPTRLHLDYTQGRLAAAAAAVSLYQYKYWLLLRGCGSL